MNWPILVLLAVIVALVFMVRSSPTVAPAQARQLLASGGFLIDVRSPEEHRAERIVGAINLPLDGIAASVAERIPSKETPLLLHCRSGARSDAALRQLKALGYREVHNLGGLEQARNIVGGGR